MVRALILRGDLFQRLFILLELFRQRADLSTQLFIFLGQFYAVLKMCRRLGFRRFLLFRRFLEHLEHLLLRDLFNVDLLHRSALLRKLDPCNAVPVRALVLDAAAARLPPVFGKDHHIRRRQQLE